MKEPKARLLVIEDDPAILRGLIDVFTFNGFEAVGVEDGGEGLQLALDRHYDLVVLDVMLPTLDGFTVCRELRKKKPSQVVLMLTAKGAEDDVVTGFTAGADDYVAKPFSLRELMVRIEALLRRAGRLAGEACIRYRDLVFDATTLTLQCGEQSQELTRREMDIFAYLFVHRDRIVSKKELLLSVWHYADVDIETRTVDIHIQKLRKKISRLHGERPVIGTIRGEGYRLVDENAECDANADGDIDDAANPDAATTDA